MQTALDGGQPAVRLSAAHPYAVGFSVDGTPLPADVLVLDTAPGEYKRVLAVRTGYGALPGRELRYRASK